MPQQITQGRQLISMLTWVLIYVISTFITRLVAKSKITTEDPFQKISPPSVLSRITSSLAATWLQHPANILTYYQQNQSCYSLAHQSSNASTHCYQQPQFCCPGKMPSSANWPGCNCWWGFYLYSHPWGREAQELFIRVACLQNTTWRSYGN